MKARFDYLIDGRMLRASGIGTYLRALLPLLRPRLQGAVAVLCQSKDLELVRSWGYTAIPWDAGFYAPFASLTARFWLPACQVFWSPHFNVPLFPPDCRALCVTIHDVFHLDQSFRLSFAQRLYSRLLLRNATARADALLSVSEFSASRIGHYFPRWRQRVQVIPNGLSTFAGIVPSPRSALATGRPYVLMVGNVKAHKNIARAIEAFLAFFQRHPEYDLVIVGSKSGMINTARLPTLSDEISRHILFTGFVTDEVLLAYYRHCALFLFPSLYEGFGLPVLEAASQGAQVCCSRIPAVEEIAGPPCHFFDPENSQDMAKAMENALASPAPSPERTQAWLDRYSWELSARLHYDVLHRLAKDFSPV